MAPPRSFLELSSVIARMRDAFPGRPGLNCDAPRTYVLLFGAMLIALGFRLRPDAHERLAPGLQR